MYLWLAPMASLSDTAFEAENEQFRTVFRRDIRHTIDGSIVADSVLDGNEGSHEHAHMVCTLKPLGWEDTLPGNITAGGASRE